MFTVLAVCFGCAVAQNFAGGALGSYGPTTTPKPVVYPPAQVHYVNIGEDLTGDYKVSVGMLLLLLVD